MEMKEKLYKEKVSENKTTRCTKLNISTDFLLYSTPFSSPNKEAWLWLLQKKVRARNDSSTLL
jgi:hypothetical protein